MHWVFEAMKGAALAALLVAPGAWAGQTVSENYAGRAALVFVPSQLAPAGQRALVVVLHGGLGNAMRLASQQSESALNLDAVAQANGFVVAYLNGTPVTRLLGTRMLGWNAGDCCGQPAENKVDDVAYVQAAARQIAEKYGVDNGRIFGVGHSNGAMMTQRLMCETALYAAAVSISGSLENGASACMPARGKHLLALHGADDRNVPIDGGRGSKGLSRTNYVSQAETAKVWQGSGAFYDLQIIAGADHAVDAIDAQIRKTEGQSLAQKIAIFLGLAAR